MADPAPIVAENVSHSYGTGSMRRQVLQDINFRVDPGEVVLLTGPPGCGKTTLLTLVGALRSLQHGQLQVLGVPLAQAGRGERRRLRQRIGMIFQGHNLLRCLTAEQNVQMGADLLPIAEAGQKISAHLHVLLGGEATQQVVTLKNHADALAQSPPLAPTSLG